MIGSTPLDIFIGLVFIYLTYSLLATILMEIIATNLGFRARNLKIVVIRMLSDEEFKGTRAIKAFISGKYIGESGSLARSFYKSHIIKNLSSGSYFSKPSAVSPEIFVEALISVIGKGQRSIADNVIAFLNDPTQRDKIGAETYDQLKFFLEDSNQDLEKFKERLQLWFKEMTIRSIGWYKRRVQVILFAIGLVISTIFNVDTLAITQKLSQDDEATTQLVQLANTDSYAEYIKNRPDDKQKQMDAYKTLSAKAFETQQILSLSRCDGEKGTCTCFEKYFFGGYSNFIGCLLSALAISLGAPFWYDLLNKLMQFKASVYPNIDDKKDK